jgi:hypothetical protein
MLMKVITTAVRHADSPGASPDKEDIRKLLVKPEKRRF